jgi:hypothetical protein
MKLADHDLTYWVLDPDTGLFAYAELEQVRQTQCRDDVGPWSPARCCARRVRPETPKQSTVPRRAGTHCPPTRRYTCPLAAGAHERR